MAPGGGMRKRFGSVAAAGQTQRSSQGIATMTRTGVDRRALLRGAAASALAVPLLGLHGRRAAALARIEPVPSPYGPIAPVRDRITDLPLLQLPEGFSYQSFGWAGDPMDNGAPTPTRHDGMAVVRARLVGGQPELTLIRNHEADVEPGIGLIDAPAVYDRAEVSYEGATGRLSGGTTRLVMRGDRFVSSAPALGGTIYNCAGGVTSWNTWLSCEEDKSDFSDAGGLKHGYVFEVSDDPARTSGRPIVAMGRFDHEAVALDPLTGAVYLTEDDRNQAGFYKFVPSNLATVPGALEQGGKLFMAKVAGTEGADLLDPRMGESHRIEWVRIEDPDLAPQPFDARVTEFTPAASSGAPVAAPRLASGPFVQGRAKSGLRMSRLEGLWYSARDRRIYLVDTSSGQGVDEESGQRLPGFGDGSIWAFDPAADTLTCIFQAQNPLAGNNFDNITVSPRGGMLVCEDGGGHADDFGPGERLMGLTPAGETYIFAKNNITLTAGDIRAAGKSAEFVQEGDYRETEWTGIGFDPSGRWLFVNIQTPGITVAITGPWERGLL
jgi:secreted PhoX family phosphatase